MRLRSRLRLRLRSTPMRHSLASLALVLLVLPAAACGKKDKPAPPPPPAPAAPAKPLPPDDSACKLLPKDDAARWFGRAVGDGIPGPGGGPVVCTYMADSPPGSVRIEIVASGDDGLGASLKSKLYGAEPVQMPGIGTRAYRSDAGGAFGVLAKGKFVSVVATSSDNQLPAAPAAEKLAQLLVNRL
jgi:hypothetical protein